MKKFIFILLALQVFISVSTPVFGCTSFAVYEGKPIYGMNFDYPRNVELKFVISTHGNLKTFHLDFFVKDKKFWAATAGMNSYGLFSSLQLEYPAPDKFINPGTDTLYLWDLCNIASIEFDKTEKIINFLENKRLIQSPDLILHYLFADINGKAITVEAGDEGNFIAKIQGKYHVMTNFPVRNFVDKPYEEVVGAGDERYKIVHRYLEKHAKEFDVNHALILLQAAVNTYEGYPTRSSMVFVSTAKVIYIALEENFNKIWKVSLDEETIETFRGFKTSLKYPLNEKGILGSELCSHE